jgi:hypothetical protein
MSINTASSSTRIVSNTNCFFNVACDAGLGETVTQKRSKSASKRKPRPSKMKLPLPKGPMNAYNFFFKDQRDKLLGKPESPSDLCINGYTVKKKRAHVKVHGKISLVDLVKKIAKKWRGLSTEELQQYRELAKNDGIRYENDVKVYTRLSLEVSPRVGLNDHADQKDKRTKPRMLQQKPVSRNVDKASNDHNWKRCSGRPTRNSSPSTAALVIPYFTHRPTSNSGTLCISSIREPVSGDIPNLKGREHEIDYKGGIEGQNLKPELEPINLNVMRSYSIQLVELSLSVMLQYTGVDLCAAS